MFQDSSPILGYYLEDTAKGLEGFSRSGGVLNFRCPICGDSKNSKQKKRAYIYQRGGEWWFHCHNVCGASKGAFWLKNNFPSAYSAYVEELLGSRSLPKIIPRPQPPIQNLEIEKIRVSDTKSEFIPILNGSGEIFEIAKSYCLSRKISEIYWKRFFVATVGKYKNRLIIPFWNGDGESYDFFQGRALFDQTPKYLSKVGDKKLFNVDLIDKTAPVVAVEGPIDAMFVENCVAFVGLGLSDSLLSKFEKDSLFICLDNDKSGREKSIKLLRAGYFVFNWRRFLEKFSLNDKVKDVNDVFIRLGKVETFKFEDLSDFFTRNIYDELDFL